MSERIVISVREEYISEGNRRMSDCPVDRALRAAGIEGHVAHDILTLYCIHKNYERAGEEIPLPNKAKKFIKRFDHNAKVEPFEFEIVV